MADEHLEKTLLDLQSQREKRIADFRGEIERLDTAIEAIRKLVQPDSQTSTISVQVSDAFTFKDNASASTKGVQPGDFFGKPQADAAREYLKRLGRAATVDDIFAALQRGGVKFTGKDPKKNLYISLTMRKAIFVSVAPYTFGLWEFYPDAKGEKTGGRLSAQIEEVMQDGKSHRVVDIMRMLEEKFGQKVTRSSVGSVLFREDQFRKVGRGKFKLKKEVAS